MQGINMQEHEYFIVFFSELVLFQTMNKLAKKAWDFK